MLRDTRFSTGYFANHKEAKKAEVAILFSRLTPFQCMGMQTDPLSRYRFLDRTIADQPYIFACVYAPNVRQHRFLARVLLSLEKFWEGLLLIAGDVNFALDPRIDTSRGHSTFPQNSLCLAKKAIQEPRQPDSCRVLHADDQDYSYYSPRKPKLQQAGLYTDGMGIPPPTPGQLHSTFGLVRQCTGPDTTALPTKQTGRTPMENE
ncbi:Hypothetical predicted protein [Pelobates cultripes]|uniref:Endonuclease/exonuclease/phosphatase domain-containing protein n=1 Tax=Pelobates cultripes TaxID=61616 RepID=A0AAD1S8P3_PELCU|nr:Hypothetical predicted protein [Pelobates cultripes]